MDFHVFLQLFVWSNRIYKEEQIQMTKTCHAMFFMWKIGSIKLKKYFYNDDIQNILVLQHS